jgi:hypothetical protein
MDYFGKKFTRILKIMGYIGIVVGFIGMVVFFILLIPAAYKLIINVPGAQGGSPVIPGLPIAGTGLFFPLITGWIAITIIIIVHIMASCK